MSAVSVRGYRNPSLLCADRWASTVRFGGALLGLLVSLLFFSA